MDVMLKAPCSSYTLCIIPSPSKSKERNGASTWQSLLFGVLSSIIIYGDPSVAGTGLRSKGEKMTKFSASCAAVLTSIHNTSSHVCPERVNSESSSAVSGLHTALDLVRTLAWKHPPPEDQNYHSAPLNHPFDRWKSEPGAQKSHTSQISS